MRKRFCIAAASFGLAMAISSCALAADSAATTQPTSDVAAELNALRQRVADLERKLADKSTSATREAEVRQAVSDVMKDAAARSQPVAAPFTAGYTGGRFVIQSDDGNFSISPGVLFQFHGVATHRGSGRDNGPDADTQSGFEVRRARFFFDGNAFGKDLTYHFRWATNRGNGQVTLEEGWIRQQLGTSPFAFRAGLFANGWSHETGTNAGLLLAVDRSLPHEIFGGVLTGTENYVQGVELIYHPNDRWNAFINLNDGVNSRGTDFRDLGGGATPFGLSDVQWGVAGRVEYKVTGDWRNYADFTARGTRRDLLVFGIGGSVDAATGATAYFHAADVQWEPASLPGFALFASYYGLARDFRNAPDGQRRPYDWGAVVQASYLIRENWEVFARYGYVSLDAGAPGGVGTTAAAAAINDNLHEIVVGLNYYWHDHNAKLTLDVLYLPTGSPLDLGFIGVLAQPDNEPQLIFRGQVQLML